MGRPRTGAPLGRRPAIKGEPITLSFRAGTEDELVVLLRQEILATHEDQTAAMKRAILYALRTFRLQRKAKAKGA